MEPNVELLEGLVDEEFMKKHGVWGVAFSRIKYKGEKAVEMPTWGIVFYVEKKLPPEKLPPGALIPSTIQAGGQEFWTDVVEAPMPSPLVRDVYCQRFHCPPEPPAVMAAEGCTCNKSRCRPVEGGVSMCDCELTACTATGWFVDKEGNFWLLTNAHCTKAIKTCNPADLTGRPMCQPSPMDGGNPQTDVVGTVEKASDIFKSGYTDTALIKPSVTDPTPIVHGVGVVKGWRLPQVGETVVKSGRTTGVTECQVQGLHGIVLVNYGCRLRLVKDVIITMACSEPGDSGSPVLSKDGYFVGQLFAGSPSMTILISPERIVREFGVEPYVAKPIATTKATLEVGLVKLHVADRVLAQPGTTVQLAVSSQPPVDGLVEVTIGERKFSGCMRNGVAVVPIEVPEDVDVYDVYVALYPMQC